MCSYEEARTFLLLEQRKILKISSPLFPSLNIYYSKFVSKIYKLLNVISQKKVIHDNFYALIKSDEYKFCYEGFE